MSVRPTGKVVAPVAPAATPSRRLAFVMQAGMQPDTAVPVKTVPAAQLQKLQDSVVSETEKRKALEKEVARLKYVVETLQAQLDVC